MAENWELENLAIRNSSIEGLKWLKVEEFKQLQKLFKHLNLENYLDGQIIAQNALEMKIEKVVINSQELKFDNRTKLEIGSGEDLFVARLSHIEEVANEDGTFNLRMVVIENNKIKVDVFETTSSDTLELTGALIPEEHEVSANAWYSDVPCVQNGCCTFTDYYMGVKLIVAYNWCGANCGSGTPINSSDTCCRTHDYCYQSFTSYPDKCSCDQNLVNCLEQTSNTGSWRMALAFKGKMAIYC